MSNEPTRAPESGPFVVDYCHGMVGGPAVIGPTGVHGFMQGRENDRKAEALCARLNAAWAELGDTVEFLRAKRVELETRIAEVLEADRKTRDEFIEAWKAKAELEQCLAVSQGVVAALVEERDDALRDAKTWAVALEEAQAMLRSGALSAESRLSERESLLRRAVEAIRVEMEVHFHTFDGAGDLGVCACGCGWPCTYEQDLRALLADIESQVGRREEESER